MKTEDGKIIYSNAFTWSDTLSGFQIKIPQHEVTMQFVFLKHYRSLKKVVASMSSLKTALTADESKES